MEKEIRRAAIDDVVKIMPLLSSVAQLHGDNRKDIFATQHYTTLKVK